MVQPTKLVFLGKPGDHMVQLMQEAKDKRVFGSFCSTFNTISEVRKTERPNEGIYFGVDVDGKLMFLHYDTKVDEYLAQAENDKFGMTASEAVKYMIKYFC